MAKAKAKKGISAKDISRDKRNLKELERKAKSKMKKDLALKKADIINWLCDYSNYEYPSKFMRTPQDGLHKLIKYQVIPSSPYIIRTFINKWFNNLSFQQNQNKQTLMALKEILRMNGLSKFDWDNMWVPYSDKHKFIMWYQENYEQEEMSYRDVERLYFQLKVLNYNPSILVQDKNNEEELEKLNSQLKQLQEQEQMEKMQNDNRYIKELTQEYIDEHKLIHIDSKILENINKTLHIFVDQFDNKRFYISEFHYEFILSTKKCILDNDFIVDFDRTQHIPIVLNNINHVKTLKRNLSFKFGNEKNKSIYLGIG